MHKTSNILSRPIPGGVRMVTPLAKNSVCKSTAFLIFISKFFDKVGQYSHHFYLFAGAIMMLERI